MPNATPNLPQLPQKLPASQAEWQQFMTALQQWKEVLQGGKWTAPTLLNGWANNDSVQTPAGYRIDLTGTVWLRGLIKGGASATTAFQIPVTVPYRHTFGVVCDISAGYQTGELDVDNDGSVSIYWTSGTLVWFPLNGISFSLLP